MRLSVAALGGLLQLFSVLLFTFYLVADGPKLRRAICSRLTPGAPGARAVDVGAGGQQDRWLPVLAGPAGAAVGGLPLDRVPGGRHPGAVALALWVGLVSQFLPVVGTYIAGVLPVLLTFLDSPVKAADRADRHRRVPADRELPVLAAHHGPHDGAAPGAGVRRRARRCGRARAPSAPCSPCRRRRWCQAIDQRLGRPPPGHRERAHRGAPCRRVWKRWAKIRKARGASCRRSARLRRPSPSPTRSGSRGERPLRRRRGARPPTALVAWSVGDPTLPIYARSALKPLQAAAMLGAGLDLTTGCWRSCAPATTAARARRRRP